MQTSNRDEVSSKVAPLSRALKWYVICHLHARKSGWFPTFSGLESNLTIWLTILLLAITCVSDVQMGHASPFEIFTFQKLSNDVRNSSIQWVLTPTIALWRFESPLKFQLPTWEFIWECGGSILTLSYTLNLPGAWNVTPELHSWPAPLQAFTLVTSPRLGLWHLHNLFKLHNIQQHIKLQKQLYSQKIKFSTSLCHLYKIDLYGSFLVLIPSNICLKLESNMNNNNPGTTHIALACPSPLPLPPESPLLMSNFATQWPCYIIFDKIQSLTNSIDNINRPKKLA